MTEIIVAEHRGWDEAIGAGFVEFDEKPGAGCAGYAAFERRADLVREMGRDQPLGGFALGRHCPAFGSGNRRRDLGKFLVSDRSQAIASKMQCMDQGAVDNEIGVTADRRGEMRIVAQVKTEMAVILDGIFRLRLGTEHHFIDEMLVIGAFYTGENAVELRGTKNLALGKLDADGGQKFGKIVELFE